MAKPDGGPAFPIPVAEIQGVATNSCEFGMSGMSLRDYFAAEALGAYVSKLPIYREHDPRNVLATQPKLSAEQGDEVVRGVVNLAYRYADAMLAEREK